MIRVLHLITDLDIGGAEIMLSNLVSYMDKRKYQNFVVSMRDEGMLGEDFRKADIPLLTLNINPGMPNPLGIYKLVKILSEIRPHILQTWLYHADFLGIISGMLAKVPATVWNIRCSRLDRGDHPRLLFMLLSCLVQLSSLPSAVVVNSNAGRKAHEDLGYKPRRWEYIPNGFDTDRFRPSAEARLSVRKKLGLNEDTFLVGLIARFNPMKDHKNFIEAASLVHQTYPDAHFIMAGRGIDDKNDFLCSQIESYGLRKYIHLLGEYSDIPSVTAALDVACSSSYSEGFPNTIGEAMACGVPCVVTDAGDSTLIAGDAGYIVPPRNPIMFSKAVNELIVMGTAERNNLGMKARQRIVDEFSMQSVVIRYEKMYEELHEAKS